MVTAAEVRKLAARLAKAETLVAAGKVHTISGLDGYYAVQSSTTDACYLVHLKDDGGCCSCPDFKLRQSLVGQPCGHILAAELVASGESANLTGTRAQPGSGEEPAPVPTLESVRPMIDGAAALRRLSETEDAYPFAAD